MLLLSPFHSDAAPFMLSFSKPALFDRLRANGFREKLSGRNVRHCSVPDIPPETR